jgi:hypothetical protein
MDIARPAAILIVIIFGAKDCEAKASVEEIRREE